MAVMDFDQLYRSGKARIGTDGPVLDVIPWRLDGPQPIITELADSDQITGPVLECGCGLGDNALFLAERGYPITAIDASSAVIEQDREKAAARGLAVDFRVADATVLDGVPTGFNTVIDSAMMHCLTDEQRRDYLAAAHRVTEPGARLHILCFTDAVNGSLPMPGHTDEASLRRDLGEHWQVERMEVRDYATGMSAEQARAVMGAAVADGAAADLSWLGSVDAQGNVLLPVWQITATRR
jgi:ubiquinone/menaquinone biosynthesis C-methylase UbiE